MRRLFALALLLALPALTLAAPPPLDIPAEVKAAPGKWLVVVPTTTAKSVVYVGLDGLEAFPSSELKDPKKLVVQAPATPGRWRFVAVGTLGDEQATREFTIVVGDVPPGPGPGPTPPVPPTPPDDALTKALKAAYALETGALKAAQVKALAALYREAPAIVDRPAILTAGALMTTLRDAALMLVPADALPKVRPAIAEYLRGELPTAPDAPLTPEVRARAKAAFLRIAAALEALP